MAFDNELMIRLGLDKSGFETGLKKVTASVKKEQESIAGMQARITTLAKADARAAFQKLPAEEQLYRLTVQREAMEKALARAKTMGNKISATRYELALAENAAQARKISLVEAENASQKRLAATMNMKAAAGAVGGAKGTGIGAGVGAAIGASAGALGATVGVGMFAAVLSKAIGKADELNARAQALSVSPKFLQEIELIGDSTGVSAEKAAAGLAKFTDVLGESASGTESARKIFDDLGISVDGLTADAALDKVADAMMKIEDPTRRAKLAVDLFGKANVNFANMLAQGSAGLAKFKNEVSNFVISQADLDRLNAAKDGFDTLSKAAGKATAVVLGGWASIFQAIGKYSTKAGWSKQLSTGELLKIEEMRRINQARWGTVAGGKSAKPKTEEEIKKFAEAEKKLFEARRKAAKEKADDAGKLLILEDERSELFKARNSAQGDAAETARLETELLEKGNEILKARIEIGKKIEDSRKAVAEAEADLAKAKVERSLFGSVESLAGGRMDGLADRAKAEAARFFQSIGGLRNPAVAAAQAKFESESRASEQAALKVAMAGEFQKIGLVDLSQRFLSEADKMKAGLTLLTAEARDPFAQMKDAIATAKAQLAVAEAMNAKLEAGLKVIPVNSK